jgi:hypothetical protein
MKTIEELDRLEKVLEEEVIPQARNEWKGADVAIQSEQPIASQEDRFYPEPRYVVTHYSLELSWMFESLRDAFYAENLLDSFSKIEFFGRLANAANRCIKRSQSLTVQLLLAAVLHESFAIYNEIEKGTFQYLLVAINNEIEDDRVDDAQRSGYVNNESTKEFFNQRGIIVKDI